ncbi:hypothetical protein HALLA_05830 [Halostagnicola larsenii XH-48]|uniref:Uncharacterized protein n=1 Tax=Halostagnicola larsenii XH-48 TaxID=797299 RepID=W0JUL3_9EURY|nr:hypothetical protein [Halostagnicola larsenii]AHG00733.1 hypothetical protein HALLA_05830 [Halostagnicola larsenii XH-48]
MLTGEVLEFDADERVTEDLNINEGLIRQPPDTPGVPENGGRFVETLESGYREDTVDETGRR